MWVGRSRYATDNQGTSSGVNRSHMRLIITASSSLNDTYCEFMNIKVAFAYWMLLLYLASLSGNIFCGRFLLIKMQNHLQMPLRNWGQSKNTSGQGRPIQRWKARPVGGIGARTKFRLKIGKLPYLMRSPSVVSGNLS